MYEIMAENRHNELKERMKQEERKNPPVRFGISAAHTH